MEWAKLHQAELSANWTMLAGKGMFERIAPLVRGFEMIWVTEVNALPDYRLCLRFSDESQGNVDLKEFIFTDARPVVSALRDPASFAAVRAEMDAAVWSNGFDLAPEFLYARVRARESA